MDYIKRLDKRFEKNFIEDQVNEALNKEEIHLDNKRNRLRDLLRSEEDAQIAEMTARQETFEQRHQKMKERAMLLKQKREEERLKVVAEKREMQWVNKCEEMRSILSRRHTEEVFRDRATQIAIKAEMERRKQEEDEIYADLWEKDRLAKAAREEGQEAARIRRARDQLDVLNLQSSANKAKVDEEKRLKEEEGRLVDEEIALRKLEDERSLQEKRAEKSRRRLDLDKMIRYKMKRAAIEHQEELALDMKILEQCLQEYKNEFAEMREKKIELKRETLQYLEYLKDQAEIEKQREKELDDMLEADVKAMWEKTVIQRRKEREARSRLMREVMEVRKLQIAEKLQKVVKEQEEIKRDRQMMAESVEEHMKTEEERERSIAIKNRMHANDLLGQMKFEQDLANEQKRREQIEYEEGLKAEAEFQEKMKQVLLDANSHYRQHPMRRNLPSSKLSINGFSIVK